MKILLKKEVCKFCKQCTNPLDTDYYHRHAQKKKILSVCVQWKFRFVRSPSTQKKRTALVRSHY